MTLAQTLDTLENLIDRSAGYDDDKQDYRLPVRETFFNPDFRLVVDAPPLLYDDTLESRPASMRLPSQMSRAAEERILDVTDHALNQIYSKLGKTHYGRGSNKSLPGEYLSHFPDDQRAKILNWTMERYEEAIYGRGMWMVRTYKDTVRAVLDGNYPRVWNTEILRQLRRVFADKGQLEDLSITRPNLTPDALDLRLWFPNSGTGVLRVGAVIRNGETGNSRLEALPMVQRTSCTNSIVVGLDAYGNRSGYSVQHYPGATASALMTQFYAHLPAVLDASAKLINRLIEAEEVHMPNFRQIIDGLAIEHGWDYRFKNAIDEGSEGQRTLAGLINGISYAAHVVTENTPEQMLQTEIISGNLLFAPQAEFTRLVRQAEAGKRIRA